MQRPLRLSNQSGFTIVETLIVLAIAGIMLLLVFEAIPSLERSGRNNQRKQDIQTILSAVSHYELNNSGNLPPDTTFLNNYKLTYYTTSEITITATNVYGQQNSDGSTSTYSNSTLSNSDDIDKVAIYNHAKCDSNNDGNATPIGASYSDTVALYAIETGSSSSNPQCQQL